MIGRVLSQVVTIRNVTDGPPNEYGDPTEVTVDAVAPARILPLSAEEHLENRDTRISDSMLLLPFDANISATSRVSFEAEWYEVVGEPVRHRKTRRGPSHAEAVIRLIEG